jgi:hypothetical protein
VGVKGLSLAGPPRSGETSRFGSMQPMAELRSSAGRMLTRKVR